MFLIVPAQCSSGKVPLGRGYNFPITATIVRPSGKTAYSWVPFTVISSVPVGSGATGWDVTLTPPDSNNFSSQIDVFAVCANVP